jgi:small subunit ribosomal protein S18
MTTSQGRDSRGGGGGGGRPQTRRFTGGRRRRQCICREVGHVDYKDVSVLRRFISDRGRIESGRKAGNCAKCQRELSRAIAQARFLGLLPYAPNHLRVTGSISPSASPESAGLIDEPEDDDLLDDESEDDDDDVEPSDGDSLDEK